jgi:predicted nucleotidyltransferase
MPDKFLKNLRNKKHLDKSEQTAVELIDLIRDSSGTNLTAIGISGSIMIGLQQNSSDIDLIVYGRLNSRNVRNSITESMNNVKSLRQFNMSELEKLYHFRSLDSKITFEKFVNHEKRKRFQGIFKDREFFIRYLPNLTENVEKYGEKEYSSSGFIKVRARISDDSEAFFSPCSYKLENTIVIDGVTVDDITEVASFRGRFCEQAKKGEDVIIQGKLEKISSKKDSHYRILLGGRPSDYMISKSL